MIETGSASTSRRVVVVGASIAGFSAAAELRSRGFEGRITLVGEEPVRTYRRPPLSKELLAGADADSISWVTERDESLDLEWVLGERAESLDPESRRVHLSSGEDLAYDGLVLACGARARSLPDQPDLAGIHLLRTMDDALGLRADLDAGAERVVVVGAGFIGAEVAATCRRRGHGVTMVDPLEQPLVRVLGVELGAAVADLHRGHGVDVRTGVGVAGMRGAGRIEAVELDDGSLLPADVVVIGVGVVPNTDWLDGSGLAVDNGVVCDASTSVAPGITACGDVAAWDSPRYGRVRFEHWDNAIDMGRAAGARLLASDDEAEAFDPVAWFWSDQYDVKLQLAGRAEGEMVVTEGAIGDDRFVALFRDGDEVRGALGWNWPARVVRYRMALEKGLSFSEATSQRPG